MTKVDIDREITKTTVFIVKNPCGEDRPQHQQEYDHYHSGTQYPAFKPSNSFKEEVASK